MPEQVFFSIVIPTYNRADLIGYTIDSVRRQSFTDYEIIVVDNHSTDNTQELLRPLYESGVIRFIRNERNFERAYSRNVGFREAKGKYVTLLDSDDLMYDHCLQEASDHIRKHPAQQIFHGRYDIVDMNGQFKQSVTFPPIGNGLKALAQGNFLSNICIFYKRELVQQVQYDETPVMIGVEDYDFLIRAIGTAKELGRVERVLGGLREHPHRSVHGEKPAKTLERIGIFYDKHTSSPSAFMYPYRSLFKAHLNLYLCSFFAVRKKFFAAMKYWFKAFGAAPSILFTGKFWRHLLVVIKYQFRPAH